MTEEQVRVWFAKYLATFEALGSGEEDDLDQLIGFYNVPLLLTTDDAATTLTTDEALVGTLQAQVDSVRQSGFARSVPLQDEVQVLNANASLYTALFSRQRADGSEISRLRVTYSIVSVADGLRIASVAVHSQAN